MEKIIEKHISLILQEGFLISDEGKVLGYLRGVGLYRLRKYFSHFEERKVDFQRVIDCYLFDKNIRNLTLNIIESIEVYLKNIFILNFQENYGDETIYSERFRIKRVQFISDKIIDLKKKDREIMRILEKYSCVSGEVFISKLTFGEIVRFFQDLTVENKLLLSRKIGIELTLLENWLSCLVYLRNICSHGENIFNKEMVLSIKGRYIEKMLGVENKNRYISYFVIVSLFRKALIPNYQWEEKVFKKMQQYNLTIHDFGQKKETFPNEHSIEAWKVLVQALYEKYVRKSNTI